MFLIPLGWWAGRFCWLAPIDLAYHATLALHERLPLLLAAAAVASVVAVAVSVARVCARAATLMDVATPPPFEVKEAIAYEARRAGLTEPTVAYLDVATPLCFTLAGTRTTIVFSRGFLKDLDNDEIHFAVRHELMHVHYGDPIRGLIWHLIFAALLFPGFEPLERLFSQRRELRAHLAASREAPDRYTALLERRTAQKATLCVDGAPSAKRSPAGLFAGPLLATAILAALVASHFEMLHNIGYLATHHC